MKKLIFGSLILAMSHGFAADVCEVTMGSKNGSHFYDVRSHTARCANSLRSIDLTIKKSSGLNPRMKVIVALESNGFELREIVNEDSGNHLKTLIFVRK